MCITLKKKREENSYHYIGEQRAGKSEEAGV
jgi:hypothetical protein